MRQIHFAVKIMVILCLAALPCIAQSQAVVKHNVNLRQDPSTDQPPIRKLLPPEALMLIEPDPTGGYYHVQTNQGEDGWVWAKNIEIPSAADPGPTTTPNPTSPAG